MACQETVRSPGREPLRQPEGICNWLTIMSLTLNVIFLSILFSKWLKQKVLGEIQKAKREPGEVGLRRRADEIKERMNLLTKKVKVAQRQPVSFHFEERCQYYKACSGAELRPCSQCIRCMHQREGR